MACMVKQKSAVRRIATVENICDSRIADATPGVSFVRVTGLKGRPVAATRPLRCLMAKPVLLLVEGDEELRNQIRRDLEHRYGARYRIIDEPSGSEALATLRRLKDENELPALIVTDQNLPDMTGVEFLERARRLSKDAKAALLTTFDDTQGVIEAMKELRFDDYLVKPCQPAEQKLYPVIDDLIADWEARPVVEALRVIGSRFSPEGHQIRDFLVRNCVPFEWLDIERDERARRLLGDSPGQTSPLPVVVLPDGTKLIQPTNAEIAEKNRTESPSGRKVLRPGDRRRRTVGIGGGGLRRE